MSPQEEMITRLICDFAVSWEDHEDGRLGTTDWFSQCLAFKERNCGNYYTFRALKNVYFTDLNLLVSKGENLLILIGENYRTGSDDIADLPPLKIQKEL